MIEVKEPKKLIEGMKTLRVIEKRMDANTERINQYACILNTERPHFKDEAEQQKEIGKLIQANIDLSIQYLGIKRQIELTNLHTDIKMDGKAYSIADLLIMKRKLGRLIMDTYHALNDDTAKARMRQMGPMGRIAERGGGSGLVDPSIQLVRLYDENDKHEQLRKWDDLLNEIDSKLEIINATTDLVDE